MANKAVQKKQQTAVVPIVSPEIIEGLVAIEDRCKDLVKLDSQIEKMFATSQIVQELQATFDQPGVMAAFMDLQNSPLGFKTDAKSGYAPNIVRDALVSCFMLGIAPINNQMNIISGQCYVAKEGFKYKLKNDPKVIDKGLEGFRLDDFKFVRLSPETGTMVVGLVVHWSQSGEDFSHPLPEIHVIHAMPKGNFRGGSLDQAFGKAERKAYSWLYAKITGDRIPDGDADETQAGGVGEYNVEGSVIDDQGEDFPAEEATLAYIGLLLGNPVLTQKFRDGVAQRWGTGTVSEAVAQKRTASLINTIRQHGGKVPPFTEANREEEISVDNTEQAAEPKTGNGPKPGGMQEKAALIKQIHTKGTAIYGGKKGWDAERPKLIGLVSSGKTSTTKLDVDELKTLLEVLKTKEREQQ